MIIECSKRRETPPERGRLALLGHGRILAAGGFPGGGSRAESRDRRRNSLPTQVAERRRIVDSRGIVRIVRSVHSHDTPQCSKAREEFPEVLNRAAYGNERTIVSRRGKDLAAVIPMDDLHLPERLAQEEMDRRDLLDARAALKESKKKGTVPLRNLMRELGD